MYSKMSGEREGKKKYIKQRSFQAIQLNNK